MDPKELFEQNRYHFSEVLPRCIEDKSFLDAVHRACMLAKEARRRGDDGLLEETAQVCWGFDSLSLTAEAAEYWVSNGLKPPMVVQQLKTVSLDEERSDRVVLKNGEKSLVFVIERYKIRDVMGAVPADNPLSSPASTHFDRSVTIYLQ